MTDFLLPAATLWWRELVRFYRQRSRIVGALGPPLIFWFLLGSGLSASFRVPSSNGDMGYMEYFFPGTVVLILLFTSIFSTISIIEDRREGFLQSVLVAPISRGAVVLGKTAGGTTLALMQGTAFMLLAPLVGISFGAVPGALLTLGVLAFGLTALGYIIAWQMDSTQGFHAIMNLFLIPMWLLSGAVFPSSGAPRWLQAVISLNPLTYGMAAVRRSLYPDDVNSLLALPSLVVSLSVMFIFSAIMFAVAVAVTRRR